MPPPPHCCPSESEPLRIMADYEPQGEMVVVGGDLPCYVARPSAPSSSAVLMFSDMFGVHSGRHKQICDQLASEGFLAICPDFFKDHPYLKNNVSWGMSLACFCEFVCGLLCKTLDNISKNHHTWDKSLRAKVEDKAVPWLRSQGAQRLASVGFCWGGYGAIRCCALPDFVCGISFHPSTEKFCKSIGEDDVAICRAARCPHVAITAKGDADRWKPGNIAQQTCEEAASAGKVAWRFQGDMIHGYMTRGDTTKPEVLAAVKLGMEEMVALFKGHTS